MKKVKDFMNKCVFFVKPNHSIFDVAKVFSKNNISGAPVVDKGKIVGMVSISDMVRFMSINLSDGEVIPHDPQSMTMLFLNLVKMGKHFMDFKQDLERISKTEIKHMMKKELIAINMNANLFEAACMMEKYDVNRLPVIDNGKLVGIIARADLIKALIE